MRKILTIIFLLILSSLNILAQSSDTISLNGVWKFRTDLYKNGITQYWYDKAYDKLNWADITVPGNWDIHDEYAEYAGDAWYSCKFQADKNWASKNVRILFQSVYNDSELWLNGHKVGDNHLGFLQFYFDISSYLQYGSQNEIVLRVNNVLKRGAIWNWGGIRRPVWLEVTPLTRINRLAINAVPDLKKGNSVVKVAVELGKYAALKTQLNYSLAIFYHEKEIYSSGLIRYKASSASDSTILSNINIIAANTHLWHFEHPELYTLKASIFDGKAVLHSITDRFGIRKIEVEGLRLKLNGEEIRPVGFNLVPEDRITGNTLPLDRIKKMVDMMKECGANMARVSHMPLPKEFLDYLDEKGIMTFEEVSLWGKDILVDPSNPLPKLWLKKMIRQQYNHPSVIGWSVGNEIGSFKNNPLADAYIKGAIEQAHQLDPDRLVTYISNSVQSQKDDPAKYCDIIMLNSYGGWGSAAEKAHINVPGKPIFFSEFGLNLNDEDPDKSKIGFAEMLSQMRNKPYVIGGSLWTFDDYRSIYWSAKSSWITPVSQNRAWGVVTTTLKPKKTYDQIRKEYLPFKLDFSQLDIDAKHLTGKISIMPRGMIDFPAYKLKDYTIQIVGLGEKQQVLSKQTTPISAINPGQPALIIPFDLSTASGTQAVSFIIMDGQQYRRFDTLVYLYKPTLPLVRSIHTGNSTVRIVLENNTSATAYSLQYGVNNLSSKTPLTTNNFIDVKDLTVGLTYNCQVIAHNNAGTTVSETFVVTPNEHELPPVIWDVQPVKNGFFVAYSSDLLDYRYEIAFGIESNHYDKQLTLSNRGVLEVPGLESNKRYFFRMRRIMQWGFASEWTDEHVIMPL